MVVVLPLYPDQDGRISKPPNNVGRFEGIETLREAGGDRVAVYGIENSKGVPIYVHAKVCVIDDVWASVGSDNVNRRSWTHDSELSCAVVDEQRDDRTPTDPAGLGDGARKFARDLRLTLAREHLGRKDGDDDDLVDPVSFFDAFAECAAELEQWHLDLAVGQAGPRPQGQLRRHVDVRPSRSTLAWARPLFRAVYDPDGRPRPLRRSRQF
jgi:phosphatidylserine/phosphatidylglycerophosphate/cardiolipin synthase-like enzyme